MILNHGKECKNLCSRASRFWWGSAIWKNLQDKGYTNLIGRTHQELDLLDGVAVRRFFDEEQPEYVFLAAAFVGGIMANSIYRADFIYKNLQIQQNVIGESFPS